jgi:hypothetical protein
VPLVAFDPVARKRSRGTRELEDDPRAPQIRDRAEELREVLLLAGTAYGVMLDAVRGDRSRMSEWRSWIDWQRNCLVWKVAQAAEFSSVDSAGGSIQEWSDVVTGGLDLLQRLLTAGLDDGAPVWPEITEDAKRDLEHLSDLSRQVEIAGAKPLDEVRVEDPSAGLGLLGALADSYVLTAYGSELDQELCAAADEIYRRLTSARKAGVWSFLDPSAPVLPRASVIADGPDTRGLLPSAKALRDDLVLISSQSFRFYCDLGAHGRELSDEERQAACERLRLDAICLRRVARERWKLDLLAARGVSAMTVEPTIFVVRAIQRSLVLALSDDPERRQRAVPSEELGGWYRPVFGFWMAS